MMRSLWAGVSGLKTHQTKMDVIGNNIANVNTVGYKAQSATFQDLVYQTTQSSSGANENTGRAGTNARQIGLGVTQGAISTNIMARGASQNTGNAFDIQLNSDAFFIVNDGKNNFFTRAGTFTVDGNGTLCMTTNGYKVQGWQADESGDIIKNTVSDLKVMSPENKVQDPEATKEAYLSGIIDKNDPSLSEEKGGTVSTIQFYDAKGYSYTLKMAITENGTEGEDPKYAIKAIDLLNDQGKSLFDLYDSDQLEKDPTYVKQFDTAEKKKAALDALQLFDGKDSQDLIYNKTTGAWANPDSRDFTLDVSKFVNSTIDVDGVLGGMDNQEIKVDTGLTKNIDNNGVSTVAGRTGNYQNSAIGAGRAAGEMDSLSVTADGRIYASYTNGVNKCLGQISVANFANPAGLEKIGENLYAATQNSGQFDGVGMDVTADGGSMTSGVLEMSNVDLSSEFTEMITTQRGFQANSRIITVSDTMIEELVNLKR